MAPLAPQKKVLVSRDFLDTDHGEIECETCHGGDPEEALKEAAHHPINTVGSNHSMSSEEILNLAITMNR